MINDQDALETTIHVLVSALIPGDRQQAKRPRKGVRASQRTASDAPLPPLAQRQ